MKEQSSGRRLSISLGKYATVFQTEIYAALGYAYEIHMDLQPEEYVRIFSDSQAALKALEAATTTFPLVQQCQKAMNDISTQHSATLFQVTGHSRVDADELAREGTVHRFVAPELVLGYLGRL